MIRRPMLPAFALGLAVALSASALPASAQQVTLRWKFEKGTELVYRMTNHVETELAMDQGTSVTEQTQTMRWRVLEVAPNGDGTLRITTERVEINMKSPMLNLAYDSETDEAPDNPLAKILSPLVGMSYRVVMGPDGTVKSVEGMDQLREAMLEAMAPEMAGIADAMILQMSDDETTANMLSQQAFPEHAGLGDTWDTSSSIPMPMFGAVTVTPPLYS